MPDASPTKKRSGAYSVLSIISMSIAIVIARACSQIDANQSRDITQEQLIKAISDTNAVLPKTVGDLRIEKAQVAQEKHVTYVNTVLSSPAAGLDPTVIRKNLLASLESENCKNGEYSRMSNGGVTQTLILRGNDGVEVVRIVIAPTTALWRCGKVPLL